MWKKKLKKTVLEINNFDEKYSEGHALTLKPVNV